MKKSKKEFEQNLLQLQRHMFNFALSLTSNKERARDLMQETTLKALDNSEKYQEETNFKGWIYTIMHNLFVNDYRRLVHTQTIIDQTDNLYYLDILQTSTPETPEQSYSYTEITKVLESFDEEHKRPFMMYMSGYKYQEIADQMNLPIGTIKSRIFYVRQHSQELLKDFR